MRSLPLILLLAAAPAVASAQAAAPTWVPDKAASRVGFRAAMNGEGIDGRFSRWDAQIAFDPKNLAASRVTATIDLASAVTGDGARDEALPSSDWFDVRRHPRATFVTRRIRSTAPGRYVAEGDLTLRGVKRSLNLPFTLAITGDVAKVSGSVAIDRTAFGVGQGQWRTGAAVATAVTVQVALTARRAR